MTVHVQHHTASEVGSKSKRPQNLGRFEWMRAGRKDKTDHQSRPVIHLELVLDFKYIILDHDHAATPPRRPKRRQYER